MSSKGWKKGYLSDIATVLMGQSPKGETCNKEGMGTPLLNGPTEFGDKYPNPVQYTRDPKRIAEGGEILFCVRGSTTGRMNWSHTSVAIGRGLASIKPIHSETAHYVKAVLDYKLPILLSQATGSTFPNVNKSMLDKLEIKYLSINEQKIISNLFETLDAKIELNNQNNQTLEEMAQAIFKHWFVDFEFPNKNGEPYKSSGGKFMESKLGMIPEEWEIGNLGSLINVQNGFAFKSKDFNDIGVNRIIKIKNIASGLVDIIETDYIEANIAMEIDDKFRINGGNILIAMTGAEIGKIGIVPLTNENLYLNQRVGKFIEKVSGGLGYSYNSLNRSTVQETIRNTASGSAQPNISAKGIESIKIVVPSENLLDRFALLTNRIIELIARNYYQNNNLMNVRDTLLPKLMSGEIRIPDAEQEVEACLQKTN